MTMYHLHHTTPVHLGGKNSPQVLMVDYDHAQLHFERFMSGKDHWFHGGLLFLLEPEQELLVRKKYSELMTGEGNPQYGVEPIVKGWSWWTDGTKDIMSEKQPEPDFFRGRTNISRGHDSVKGRQWYNNGIEEILSFSCPENFTKGRLPHSDERNTKCSQSQKGKIWWNNGTEEKWSHHQPEGFVKGRLKGKGNTQKPVKLLDTQTEETLHFLSYKECYTYLEITKKVFMNRLNKGKKIHNRYIPCKG